MNESPDPGWRDADRSRGLDAMVSALDHFDAWRPLQATRRALYRALRPRPGARILDGGCGTGVDVAALAALVQPGGSVQGIDDSHRMVSIAQERYGSIQGVTFSRGDVRDVPFPEGHFDAAFAMRTLQYLDQPIVGIRELARVTRPGGRVAVVEGGMSVMDLPSPELVEGILGEFWGRRSHSFAGELFRLMRTAGLQWVRVVPVTRVEHRADSYFLDFARKMANEAATDEALAWAHEVVQRDVSGKWFAAELLFVVVGTVRA